MLKLKNFIKLNLIFYLNFRNQKLFLTFSFFARDYIATSRQTLFYPNKEKNNTRTQSAPEVDRRRKVWTFDEHCQKQERVQLPELAAFLRERFPATNLMGVYEGRYNLPNSCSMPEMNNVTAQMLSTLLTA